MKHALSCFIFAVFVLFTLFWFILAVKSYNEYKIERLEKYEAAKKYYYKNCKDPQVIQDLDIGEDCKARRRTMDRDPQLYAIYDVLEGWKICDKDCDKILDGFAWNVWKLAVGLIVIYVIAVFMCGVQLHRMRRTEESDMYARLGGYENTKAAKSN